MTRLAARKALKPVLLLIAFVIPYCALLRAVTQLVADEPSSCEADPMTILPQSFCARPAVELAPRLLGKELQCGAVRARITEVEAYAAQHDSANHCFRGKTLRNEPMWGPPGHIYVYLCYGIHHLLNIVSDSSSQGAAVLIRSVEVLDGFDVVASRRGGRLGSLVGVGPGNVGALLGMDRTWNHHRIFESGGLELHDGPQPPSYVHGPRVGIGYAQIKDQQALWRFGNAESLCLSEKKSLKPWRIALGRLS